MQISRSLARRVWSVVLRALSVETLTLEQPTTVDLDGASGGPRGPPGRGANRVGALPRHECMNSTANPRRAHDAKEPASVPGSPDRASRRERYRATWTHVERGHRQVSRGQHRHWCHHRLKDEHNLYCRHRHGVCDRRVVRGLPAATGTRLSVQGWFDFHLEY